MEWIASMQHSSSLPSLQQLKQAEVEVTVEKRFELPSSRPKLEPSITPVYFFSILLAGGNKSCPSMNTNVKAAQIDLKSNKA